MTEPSDGPPGDDELIAVLGGLQDVFFSHPVAVQRAFSALVKEGRAFARTPEGAELQRRLEGSREVARFRLLWDTLSMTAFSEDEHELLPSAFLDAAAKATRTEGLEALLSRVFIERT